MDEECIRVDMLADSPMSNEWHRNGNKYNNYNTWRMSSCRYAPGQSDEQWMA